VKVLKGEDAGEVTKAGAVLALKGRERNIGVIEVSFHPKEIEVMEGNERALKGYQDLLVTLSNIVGLLVDNLHLYEAVRLQSIVDQTTGVYNRRWFDTKLVEEIHRAERYQRDLSLLLIDLDKFKEVNDTWGHKEGDLVLVESAKIFRKHTREVDIVCRIGGDEFAIIMPETGYEGALQKAELLRKDVAGKEFENLVEPGKAVKVSLSIGVTGYTPEIKSSDAFVRQADDALYAAKRAGRNAVVGAMAKSKK
jgi:diguanylate cyclase (GGDEF)-like protein